MKTLTIAPINPNTKLVSELDHAQLFKASNGRFRLFVKNHFIHSDSPKPFHSCSVSKQDVEDATFNDNLDLQYLISSIRSKLK